MARVRKLRRVLARSIALGAVSALLGGCADGIPRKASDNALRYIHYTGAPVEEFTTFRLDNWEPVSRNQLVLWSDVNKAYLLQVWDTCPDLEFAQVIGVTSTGYAITTHDYVRVDRTRCPIMAIRPIDVKKMNEDRAAGKLPS